MKLKNLTTTVIALFSFQLIAHDNPCQHEALEVIDDNQVTALVEIGQLNAFSFMQEEIVIDISFSDLENQNVGNLGLRFPKKVGQFNSSGYNPIEEYNHEKVQELHRRV
jgi:hypothetical protein